MPEEYGGSDAGDYRFNAVLTERLAKVWPCRPASSTPTSWRPTSCTSRPRSRRSAGCPTSAQELLTPSR
ncbi:MAG: hypothetical protein R2734_04900 [Nocardioides sp.]